MSDLSASTRAQPLCGKNVVLGVSGGIAAYKAAEIVRQLVDRGATVRVVMTAAATEFVRPLTFQALSGNPVATELFDLTQESEIGHIRLAADADLLVIAPATADLIARLGAGMANDLLAAVTLATRAPLLLAPAMNTNMWTHPITQANVQRLTAVARACVVGPGDGFLACGTIGPGRMAEPADIVEAAAGLLSEHDLAGRRFLVTAGPTHEAIDAVRFLANRSSGKMGYAIARAAAMRGASVTMVSGPTALPDPFGVKVLRVTSAAELADATTSLAREADVIIMAAAVADYRPTSVAAGKLKKELLGEQPSLALTRNPDVLAQLGRTEEGRRPVLVGFAAETENVEANAREKLARKGCDLVVANDVGEEGSGFEVDTNRVTIVGPGDDVLRLPLLAKDEVAHHVIDRASAVVKGRS